MVHEPTQQEVRIRLSDIQPLDIFIFLAGLGLGIIVKSIMGPGTAGAIAMGGIAGAVAGLLYLVVRRRAQQRGDDSR